ncbi:unnamed protein product [Tilletia caries]|nr:unnamed protein product [Tilletia caries]
MAAYRGAAAGSSAASSSIIDSPRRSSYSAALHAAAAATAADADPTFGQSDGNGLGQAQADEVEDDNATESDPLLEATGADGLDLVKAVEKQAVWPILHWVRRIVLNTIDTALTWDELTSVDLNFAIVRPLAHRLSRLKSIAVVYVLLLNKIQFNNDSEKDLAYQQVNSTRALLCELLAIKMLRTFSRDGIELVTALTAPFSPFTGADEGALTDLYLSNAGASSPNGTKNGGSGRGGTLRSTLFRLGKPHLSVLSAGYQSSALELAILGHATRFLVSPLARRCVDGIWTGRVVISSYASHAIIKDSYKKRALSIYDPSKAPVLDHYRLRVPLIRSRLEFLNFLILLILFLIALSQRGATSWTAPETIFTIWLAGFTLDELAQMQEHGLGVYFSSLYNSLDALFIFICSFFLAFRISGLIHADLARQELAFDCLALGAIVLCPRVASIFVADSVVLLSLKAMLADFVFFMSLAMVCFSGFWFTFWSLVEDRETWTPGTILWTMLRICFFAGYVDLSVATTFSPIFGPPLFVIFAVVSNVMLLTILISSLSNTFMVTAMRADEEAAYQHACRSMAGVSSDALFSYIPPLNLVGMAIILPCSCFMSERYLHKTHVFLVRALSFPVLLTIRLLERESFKTGLELTAEHGRRAFSWVPLIGSSRDVDAYGDMIPTGPGGSAIHSLAGSGRGSNKANDEDDDDDNDTENGNNTGDGYLDEVMSHVVQASTLKNSGMGDTVAAENLEGEDSTPGGQQPVLGSQGSAPEDPRRSLYGQHLGPQGPQAPDGLPPTSRGGSAESATASQQASSNKFMPRTRTRATTKSSVRTSASIPLAPEPGPTSPPPRGLGSLTSPLARFFGGGGGGGNGVAPTSRRSNRGSAGPPLREAANEDDLDGPARRTMDAGGQAASSRTLLQEEQRAAGSMPAGSNYAVGTFHSAGPSAAAPSPLWKSP